MLNLFQYSPSYILINSYLNTYNQNPSSIRQIMMKQIFLVFLFALTLPGWAQKFQGVIKYTATFSGPSMEQSTQSLITIIVKEKHYHFVASNGGTIQTEIFLDGNTDRMDIVIPALTTIYETSISGMKQQQQASNSRKITRLADSLIILGHTCRHYRIENDGPTQDVWMTTGIDIEDIGYYGKVSFEGIPGVLMRSEMVDENGVKQVMEMVQTDYMEVDMKDFDLPRGFTITNQSPFGN